MYLPHRGSLPAKTPLVNTNLAHFGHQFSPQKPPQNINPSVVSTAWPTTKSTSKPSPTTTRNYKTVPPEPIPTLPNLPTNSSTLQTSNPISTPARSSSPSSRRTRASRRYRAASQRVGRVSVADRSARRSLQSWPRTRTSTSSSGRFY